MAQQRFRRQDCYRFLQIIQHYISAGVPTKESVALYKETVRTEAAQRVSNAILKEMENGVPFHQALMKQPSAFPSYVIELIRLGESSGEMTRILEEIVFHMEQEADVRYKVKSAITMPLISFIGIVGVFLFGIMYLIPKLGELLTEAKVDLPLFSRTVLSFGYFLQEFWWLWLLLLGAGIAGFLYARKNHPEKVSLLPFHVPFYKPIAYYRLQYDFAMIMGLCLSAGIQPTEAVRYAGIASDNLYLRRALQKAESDTLKNGVPMEDSIVKHDTRKLLHKDFRVMLSTGSRTGKLGQIMIDEASNYRKFLLQATNAIGDKVSISLLVPAYVAMIVIFMAIEFPVFTLMQNANSFGGM